MASTPGGSLGSLVPVPQPRAPASSNQVGSKPRGAFTYGAVYRARGAKRLVHPLRVRFQGELLGRQWFHSHGRWLAAAGQPAVQNGGGCLFRADARGQELAGAGRPADAATADGARQRNGVSAE